MCHAIWQAVPVGRSEDPAAPERVLARIEKALCPHEAVSDWLNAKHKVPHSDMTHEALLDYRVNAGLMPSLPSTKPTKGD